MQRSLRFEQYAVFALLTVLFLMVLAPFAQAILLGLLMALVFYPINSFLDGKLALPRPMRALLVMMFLSITALLPVLVLGISAFSDLSLFILDLKGWLEQLPVILSSASGLLEKVEPILPISLGELAQKLVDPLTGVASFLAQKLGKAAAAFPGFILEYLLFLLAFYFGLLDGNKLVDFLKRILPFEQSELEKLFETTKQICRGVVLGSIVAGVTQGLLMGLGFALSGVPRPLFFALLTAFMSLVPLVGSAPIAVGGLIYLGLQGSWGSFFILLVFFIAAALSDNIIKPLILRGKAELHPFLGLVGAIGGLAAFGFLGIFLGPLLVALTTVVTEIFGQRQRL